MKPVTVVLGLAGLGALGAALYFAYHRKQVATVPTGGMVPARRYAQPVPTTYRTTAPILLWQKPQAVVVEQPTGTTTNWDQGGDMAPAAPSVIVTEQPTGTTTYFG